MADERRQVLRRRPASRRRFIRHCAAGTSFAIAVLYLVLLVLVADAEAGRSENTYGAYLLLSVPYLVGGLLLARLDNRLLHLLAAVVQVGVIALFVLFGVGLLGPGVFGYAALARLHMAVWAGVITGAEVALLGLSSYLAATASERRGRGALVPDPRADAPSPSTGGGPDRGGERSRSLARTSVMTGSSPTPPNGHPVTPRPDPLDMSPGEKVAAEWEARHDVRARGSHGNPAAVQEYLQHTRSEEHRHPAQHAQPAGEPVPAPAPAGQPARKESWLHRLFHRRSS